MHIKEEKKISWFFLVWEQMEVLVLLVIIGGWMLPLQGPDTVFLYLEILRLWIKIKIGKNSYFIAKIYRLQTKKSFFKNFSQKMTQFKLLIIKNKFRIRAKIIKKIFILKNRKRVIDKLFKIRILVSAIKKIE